MKAIHKRNERRYDALAPARKFLKEHNMVMVHEAAVPKPVDPLAVENPLSQEYAGRKRRPRSPPAPQPSPSPDPEIEEQAAGKSVKLVPLHKEKRLALGAAAAEEEEAEEKAVAVLAALPAEVAAAVAKQFVSKKKKKKTSPPKKKPRVEAKEEKEEEEGGDAAKQEKIKVYYKKKLKEINDKRQAAGQGPLNKKSRAQLLKNFAPYHYKDPVVREGFAASALGRPWDRSFSTDFTLHPPAAEGEADSDTDVEE